MTEIEQRIAAAEARGWRWVNRPDFLGTPGWGWEAPGTHHTEDDYKCEKEARAEHDLPDFTNLQKPQPNNNTP